MLIFIELATVLRMSKTTDVVVIVKVLSYSIINRNKHD